MDIAKVELAALANTIEEAEASAIVVLEELQLSLVGGGVGDVILV
jgi:hypothetical protein